MKKALLKDTFREIWKTRSRFLAILLIVALGTAFFVGIKTTCPDMKLTADNYYRVTHLMDFRLLSTAGFRDDDIAAIRKDPHVKGVMPAYDLDVVTALGGKEKVLHVMSLPAGKMSAESEDYLNRPELSLGRLPQKSGECVVEINKYTNLYYNLGDTIKVSSGNTEKISDKLKTDVFTVVGIVSSPMYVSKDRGTTAIGSGQVSGFMQILDTDFKADYYNNVYLTVGLSPAAQAYSGKYDQELAPLKTSLESLAQRQAGASRQRLVSDAQAAIAEKEQDYQASLSQAANGFAAAGKKLSAGQRQIAAGRAQLAQTKTQGEVRLTAAQKELAQGQISLASAQSDYQEGLNSFNLKKQQAISAGVYDVQKAQFAAQEAQMNSLNRQLSRQAAELASRKQTLLSSQAEGEKQLVAKQAELDNAQTQLAKAQADYTRSQAETNRQLSEAQQKLAEAKAQIEQIPEVTWYVLGRETNPGYVEYGSAADRMNAIAQVFPLIFILVAILICFTSMSRMVEEQRTYMGTVKALGYSKGAIALKFLIYAITASLVGGAVGLTIGFSVFPSILYKAYSILFSLPKLRLLFDVPFALLALAIGILVTSVSALIVCIEELNSNTAALMRPRSPKAGKTILLERIPLFWTRLKFTQKVTARNLFRYKPRFFMTVVGVGGCTALLLVGFGLNDAISTIGEKQYGELFRYQLTVSLKDHISTGDRNTLQQKLKEQNDYSAMENLLSKSVNVEFNNREKSCYLIVPDDPAAMSSFISLRSRTTQESIPLTDAGVVLSEKLAAMLGVKAGDKLTVNSSETEKVPVTVTGITENYLQHYIYMSPNLYTELYKSSPNFNQINVRLNTASTEAQEQVSRMLVSLNGVAGVNLSSDNMQKFRDTIKSVYNIVIVLIISAGLLSFIVLYTLANININERMREIATIKVLGFYNHEVSSYVLRENLILAVFGAVCGLIFGKPLAGFVIGTSEIDLVMFGRQIYPASFVLSAVLTLGFAAVVNRVMLRRLIGINMVEALKTVE